MISRQRDDAAAARSALTLIAAFALARLVLATGLGLGVDESYTLLVSRRLDLSYFDHPPLHQWIAHFSALTFGEGWAARLPFIALFAGTGWLMFLLTRQLYGAAAGVWAVFGLNAALFFLVAAGGWIVPDGPLMFALLAAALVVAPLLQADQRAASPWRGWLLAGLWLGVAGLSKYLAIFAGFGVIMFLILSSRQRRWLVHPAPYAAALLAVAIALPVVIWNAEHHWVSFHFQAGRGTPDHELHPGQVAGIILGQLAMLTPWNIVPIIGGLGAGLAAARRDDRALLLLCLSLPAILFFTLQPLFGDRGFPHWTMPGWLFVFPLMGDWAARTWSDAVRARRWAAGSVLALAAIAALTISHANTGWLLRFFTLPKGQTDVSLEAWPWTALRDQPLLGGSGGARPGFVVAGKWGAAGRLGLALGPQTHILVFPGDPHGIAFLENPAAFVGQDAVIVLPLAEVADTMPAYQPYFTSIDPPKVVSLGRLGAPEIPIALIAAHGLKKPFPMPYLR